MESHKIILFDGVCNLCNQSVQFFLKRDKKGVFKYASLQSAYGQKILKKQHKSTQQFDSFILVDKNIVYEESTAAIRALSSLPFPWSITKVFFIIPSFIRNAIYHYIAKNRYKWFGKKEACMIPQPEWKDRFLS